MTLLGPRKLLELLTRGYLARLSIKSVFPRLQKKKQANLSIMLNRRWLLDIILKMETLISKLCLTDKEQKSWMKLQNAGERIEECSLLKTEKALRKRDTQPRNRQPASRGISDSVEDAKDSMEVLKSMLKRQTPFQDCESASADFHSYSEQLAYALVKTLGFFDKKNNYFDYSFKH